uniref:(California timema) hypothetical protein n=1 Tax=Timema californicum TaxID=61474 RepID=A0A7R9PA02_TIMCA|nr:unnamed protein product [Timema californicum]
MPVYYLTEEEEFDIELSDIDSDSDEDEYEDEDEADTREVEESSQISKGVLKDDVIQITKTDSKYIFESIDITKDILSFVLNKLHMIKNSVDGDGRDETESSIDSLVEVSSSEEPNEISKAIDYKIGDLDSSASKHKILNLVEDISKKYSGTIINDFIKPKEDIDKVKDDDDVTKQDIDKVDRHTIFEEKSVSLVEGERNDLKETELKQEEYSEQVEEVGEKLEENLEKLGEDIKEIENFEETKTIENGESGKLRSSGEEIYNQIILGVIANVVSDELLEKTSEDLSEIKTNVEREILEMKNDDDKEKKEKLKDVEHLDENKLIEKDSGKQLNIETRKELLVVDKDSEDKVKIDSKLIVETLDKESEEEEVIELALSDADTSETTKPTMVDNIPSDESPNGDPKEISVADTKSEGPEDFTRHILLELFKGIGIVQEEVKVVKESDKLTTAEPVEQFKTESSSSILKPVATKNNQEVSNDTPIETDCVYITKSILLEIIEKSSALKKNEVVEEKDIGGQTEDISQDIAQKLLHLVLEQLDIDSKEVIPQMIMEKPERVSEIVEVTYAKDKGIGGGQEISEVPKRVVSKENKVPEIIDFKDENIPEIIDSKEKTIPEIIDSREKTIPEIINSREKTIPEIIDSREKTIPEIIDSREKTIPEIIDSREKTIPEIIDSREKTIPEIIDSKDKTVPEISEKKAQEIVGPTEVEDLKKFKEPVVKYVKKADNGSLLDLKRTAPTFEKFEVNTQIKIKLAGTDTMTPKNIIIKLVNKADIQFDEDRVEELDDVEQRHVSECKVNQEPVTVIVDTEKEKEITQVNYTKDEFIDKESQTVLKSPKELMLFKDVDTQSHLSAKTTPSVKETTESYVNSIQSILSDKISQDERMDCFAIDIFPWPDILLGPSSNINSISYASDTQAKKYSSNISPAKTFPSNDLSLVTKKSFLAKILQSDEHDMSQEASQEIVSRKSLLDTTFDLKSAIISHSRINMETAGSQSSAMECKVLCWDEHPEKTTHSTLERVNTCDILCWRSEQYYHKTSSFSSAKQGTETPAPLYDPVQYFNKLLPGQTNQSQQGFFPEKIARFEHYRPKIALDSETKLPENLSNMPKPMQENFDFPIPQYQVYKTKGKDPTRPLTYINKVSNDQSIPNNMASPGMMFEKQSTSIRNDPARDLLPPIPRMQQHVCPYSSLGAGVVSTSSAPPSSVAQPPTPSRHVVSCYNTPMAMLASTHSHEQEVNSISEKKDALQKKLEQLEERAAIKSREMVELKQTMLQLQQQQGWQLTNIPPPTTPKVDPSLEGMKAALDNMLVKCRTKDQMITAMADELQRQRRSSAMERVLTDVATDKANMVPDFDRARLHEYLQHPRPRTVPESAQHETPGFPKGLTVLRRINPNTLLLGWDPPAPTITGIIGYDVYVNGNIQERVRSATRNRTLLHGLDLTRKIEILVYAVTPKGKFADPAFVSYQDTVDRPGRPTGHL